MDVPPAADIYSLGKVIFYMLSGGTILPREDIHVQSYSALLGIGERNNLMRGLLNRMIAPLPNRIAEVKEIIENLDWISRWEEHARALPFSAEALARIDKMQERGRTKKRIEEDNKTAREKEAAAHTSLVGSLLPWLSGELQKAALHFQQSGLWESEVRKATLQNGRFALQVNHGRMLRSDDGVELTFDRLTDTFRTKFVLQFWICHEWRVTVQIGNNVAAAPFRDLDVVIVPRLAVLRAPDDRLASALGYLNSKSGREAVRRAEAQRGIARRGAATGLPAISGTFIGGDVTITSKFKTSEWPAVVEAVQKLIVESLDCFLEYINSDHQIIGA